MASEATTRAPRRFVAGRPLAILLPVAGAVVVGALDYVTGRGIITSPFYLAPICWMTWSVGTKAGLFLAVASAAIWVFVDFGLRASSPHPAIPAWNAVMLLTVWGVVACLLSSVRNAHRRLEETVRRRTESLEAEIATRKRSEIAKIQTERLAAVGAMASGMAHEIRNPLGSITLNLDLIRKELDKLAATSQHSPEEGRLLADEIREEVRRIQRVLEDYLQFARMRKPERRALELNEFLDHKLAFLRSEFERSRVKLRTVFDPRLETVEADGEQVWQATLNLIRNSLQAMPEGGELVISTGLDDGYAVARVRDNGRGMTDEQCGQVFVPFFTTKAGGSGLGLAVVQQIATEHGGRMECESALGQGSTFTIFLPLTRRP